MKRVILINLLLLAFITAINADNFQIRFQSGDDTYNVAYSSVQVYNANNELVFEGKTDKYGRIAINITNGEYHCKVRYRETWKEVVLTIDGTGDLKQIYLK